MAENSDLPSGYTEVEHTNKHVKITREDFPWLKSSLDLSLTRIKLNTGQVFYMASAISGHGTLTDEADKVDNDANNTYYSTVRKAIAGDLPNVPKLQYPICDSTVYYSKSRSGARVYFTIFSYLEQAAVIIKIAACNKSGERKVHNIIAST